MSIDTDPHPTPDNTPSHLPAPPPDKPKIGRIKRRNRRKPAKPPDYNAIAQLTRQDDDEPIDGWPASCEVDDARDIPEWFKRMPVRAQQVHLLRSCGYGVHDIAATMRSDIGQVSYHVRQAGKDANGKINRLDLRTITRQKLMAAICEHKALRCVRGITDDKIDNAGVSQLAVSTGILLDKAAMLRSYADVVTLPACDSLEASLSIRITRPK